VTISSVSRDSIFQDDFSFYSDSVFGDDFWITIGIVCVTIPYWIINLFLLSIWCLGRAVDSTRQLSLWFQLWFQGMHRLCFRWRFLVRRDADSLAIPCVNDYSLFSIDFMHQSWISVRCRFHQSATTQFSKIISRSIVTQFSVSISGSAFAECVSHFHVLAMNLFFLSIWCVGRAVDSTRQLSLTFQLWFQGLQRLCFRWRFLVRRDVVSLANPSVNDDSIFSVDFIRQSWISVRCRFHQSAATQFSTMISRSIVMNLFLLSICCVGRAVESTRQLSFRFQLWFQGLQRLCFR